MTSDRIRELGDIYQALERVERTLRLIPTNTSLEEIAQQLEPILAAQVDRCQKIEQAQARLEQEFNRQEEILTQSGSQIAEQVHGYREQMQKDMAEIGRAVNQCEAVASQCRALTQNLDQHLLRMTSNLERYLNHVGEASAGVIKRKEQEFTQTCQQLQAATNRLKAASNHTVLWLAGAALIGAIVGALVAALLIWTRLQQLG